MTAPSRPWVERLARRYALPASAAEALFTLSNLLARDPAAPTAMRDPQKVLEDHLADSLVALEFDPVRNATTIADLGSGAGVPGLPLAIARPHAHVSLVESNRRKCEFLHRAAIACGLSNVTVVNARVEDWPGGLGRFELATARALAPLAVVVEYGAPMLVIGGHLVAWRGTRDREVEAAAEAAARELALEPLAPQRVQPYAGARSRHLHVFVKTAPTPAGFPRRPGVARKRPLGRAAP